MEGSAEIDGRKKNKKQRESNAIKQKACVRWCSQKTMAATEASACRNKNTRATCVVEQHNLLQNQKVSRVVPVCVAMHDNK